MKRTMDRLHEIVRVVHPHLNDLTPRSWSLTNEASSVAAGCFLYPSILPVDDQIFLRHQLNYLRRHGQWDISLEERREITRESL